MISLGLIRDSRSQVTDYPRFAFRSVLVDTARHFIPLSQMMAIVDAMCAVKLNAMHIHLSGACRDLYLRVSRLSDA